jgi:RluA family pseudouridine synthase
LSGGSITNIAAYRFANLSDLRALRERLMAVCKAADLRGTILLSHEGINLFLAGSAAGVETVLAAIRSVPGLETLEPKVSMSDHQPFNRMLVRLKKEIIAFGVPGINPAVATSPKIAAKTLKAWLDEGRDMVLLDTRNDYEVRLGTFQGALPIGIQHFRQFPEAVRRLPPEMKQRPLVMFCTGGIRCEKAGPFMEQEGFSEVYQLDGGILKYFEECGGSHYDGECFVFDQRVGLDPALEETHSTQCFACQTPLSEEDQADPRYEPGVRCPWCAKEEVETMRERIADRHRLLASMASPLPGSVAAENRRPVTVSRAFDEATLLDFLAGTFAHEPREHFEHLLAAGRYVDGKGHAVHADQPVRAGEFYFLLEPAVIEPPVNPAIEILHEDPALVVLYKPAPLPVHPCGRFHRNTLSHFLGALYHPEKLRPAHRLDANTTGVMVLTRTRNFAARVQTLFANGDVEKVYLARVHGHPTAEFWECDLPITDEAGFAGSRDVAEHGDSQHSVTAHTRFRVLHREPDGTSLIEARPLTGRTNQIRLHLWAAGHPIVGDTMYLPEGQRNVANPLASVEPLCLHSWRITLRHPLTGKQTEYCAHPPAWASVLANPATVAE